MLKGVKGIQAQHWLWPPYKQIEEEIRLLRVSSDVSSSAQFCPQDKEKENANATTKK